MNKKMESPTGVMEKPSRTTSLDVHLERTSSVEEHRTWFTRQMLKILLTFILTLANIVTAVVVALLKANLNNVPLSGNITIPSQS